MRVQITIDDERATGILSSSPNAIGVCDVLVGNRTVQRHVSKIKPLDAEAERTLAAGDRFVARDPDLIVDGISENLQYERPREWTIDDLELLHIYVYKAVFEAQAGPRRGSRKRRCDKLFAAKVVVKNWLKQSRMARTALQAGLSEEDMRDPLKLLRAAASAIQNLSTLYWKETGKNAPDEFKRVASVIRDYLVHGAKPITLQNVAVKK
jgi:hypothetical protein